MKSYCSDSIVMQYDVLNCALHWRIGIACLETLEAAQDASQLDEVRSTQSN